MSDEVSRDDDNAPKPEEKKTGFWKRMFTGVDADELNDTDSAPAPQDNASGEPEPTVTPPATAHVEAPAADPQPSPQAESQAEPADDSDNGEGFWTRMKLGLGKTRKGLGKGLADLLVGAKEIDDEIFEEIETQLLVADVGVEATDVIIEALTGQVSREELVDADALYESLQNELRKLLVPVDQPLTIDGSKKPYVILMVGVNGVGKTTTIGKLACRFKAEGKSVMLAAGDTFRAAAVEQLQVWGERNDIPVVAQHTGADSASVVYDAVQAAQSRGADVLIADTAGRLHTRGNLMEELTKVTRVMKKLIPDAPHEVLLVLDAGTGQNAIQQAEQFRDAAGVTGLALTKLDGTAKGGILFALAKRTGLPIRFIGVGERLEDLRPFHAEEFVQALFEDVAG
ncbi:cell division protein FtsY [Alcanivorax jadensis T9]|jgi:fused signal recognition particle receptor|uniref:Signal recognition particle receptor FtsY n=1 Tax=Alcanivorax jadensis T9 TaxID=1177181 RepID=A0ABR4WB82_9GAMM|nr:MULTISPECIES: signal recognition particle-docking protein FtsY [Alcanivorax]KGD60597.1 cell division protein FtsY [Alcanivorax jadensis T9]MAC14691.1 signal recognition particle-docking protein FtsY [Alcanivorax sp.]MBL4569723.1 signal recognition particle-docking protein FtsY [Alcanivorax sp.]MBP21919.1 signal recognition particle-docking protein FtsY [Alcanivorax sp.]MDF1635979.1 signal recognition particle-docking protein FtsY [Alcanivorax jadensis]|tara:strand:+ start:6501 stop:7697 length:1197 start_codon:yes stop_codon:yes gene_type:complete